MTDFTDFATLGQQIKQKSGAYSSLPDETVGQLYLKKTNPLQYEIYKTQLSNEIQNQQSLDLSGAKLQQEYEFKKTHPDTTSDVGKIAAKDLSLAKTGLDRVKEVKNFFEQDPSVLSKQLIPGQFLSRKFDSAIYDATDALLRLRTGAQANPAEIRGYMKKIGPSFGDSPDVVEYKLNKLQSDLAEYGGEDLKSTLKPLTLNLSENKKRSFLDNLLSIDKSKQFVQETPGILKESAQVGVNTIKDVLQGKTESAKQRNLQFLPKAQEYIKTGKDAQEEVQAKGEVVLGAMSAVQGLKSIIGLRGSIAEARNAAGAGVDFDKEALTKAAKDALKLNPAAKSEFEDVVSKQIKNAKDSEDLLKLIDKWNKLTFSNAGIKSSQKASYYNDFIRVAGDELAKSAPKAAELQKVLRLGHQIPKAASKAGFQVLKFSALGKLLGF